MTQFIRYNPNPKGINTNDCLYRALSVFFGISWKEALDDVVNWNAQNGHVDFNSRNNVRHYLASKGMERHKAPKPAVTVGGFCESVAQPGRRYLVSTKRHMTCVINQAIYDSWDCSEKEVTAYWEESTVLEKEQPSLRFLVQTIHGKIVHDFAFHLLRAREYCAWHGEEMEIRLHEGNLFDDVSEPDAYVPVGSVDFVSAYLKTFYPHAKGALLPINVPECLFPFAGRGIRNILSAEDMPKLDPGKIIYKKNLSLNKHPDNGPVANPSAKECVGFQISTEIDILSEWRVFVFHGNILDIRNYAGDCFAYPSPERIKYIVRQYNNAPAAWTLDVAVKKTGETVVIECHRFFSCGLYGFADYTKLPYMLSQTWYEMKTNK
jgi:hypothetical protein